MSRNPVSNSAPDTLIRKVEDALDSIRPYLEADGGNIEIVELTEDGALKLRFIGNCAGCTLSSMTFRAGVEEAVRRLVPEVSTVEAIN
ncbi:MAG: NifU family protein [Cyclobacteriaceae bacterium]